MSSSRKRTEHIERIRYPNPLPLPPYPPKLLAIPTPSSRYADPRTFGSRLATAHPLPMVVNGEAGMPLSLMDFPQVWYTDQEIEADDNLFPRLESVEDVDEEDAFLLSDLLNKLPKSTNQRKIGGTRGPVSVKEVDKNSVTWLRRTEYLGAEKKRKEKDLVASRAQNEIIDSSREAQLARIKDSFAKANQPIASLRHPTKAGLKAVEEHQLLPDPDTWATRFDVFRFGDPPGRTINNKPTVDIRLQAAILRPHTDSLDRGILSLFLVDAPEQGQVEEELPEGEAEGDEDRPKKTRKIFRSREEEILAQDEEADRLLRSRLEGDLRDEEVQDVTESDPFDVRYGEEVEKVRLNFVRDYEPHDESIRKDQELVFTFIDGQGHGQLPPAARFEQSFRNKRSTNGTVNGSGDERKVVYYHPVSTRASLRVRRRRANDPGPLDHWDAITLGKRSLSMYEKIERLHERKMVDDMEESKLPERVEIPPEVAVEEEEEEEEEEDVEGDQEEEEET